MPAPSVFISYSHKDEEWKDRLVTQLGVLQMEGILDVWDDRSIDTGAEWYPRIVEAINKANVAILLISANYLRSKFILNEEIPKLLERYAKEGMHVIPLIVKPCAWTQVKWLSLIQARPKDGKPLSAKSDHQIDSDLAALANEIAEIVKRVGARGPSPLHTMPLPPDKISLAKLPSTNNLNFVNRVNNLQQLNGAWENLKINIVCIIGSGGVGKSALVNNWLSQMGRENYRSAERVYAWSFYSQSMAEGRQVSADQFIATALMWFGDPDPAQGSPWDKGERLAELIKQQRTLLILDGLEPLQNPPPVETGKIKDPGLTSLLRELARQNPGMVVITTRLTVDDLEDFIGNTVLEIYLENLSDDAGAEYLRHLGLKGTTAELQAASHEYRGYALALTLLGQYLMSAHEGDISKRSLIPKLSDITETDGQAKLIMEALENLSSEENITSQARQPLESTESIKTEVPTRALADITNEDNDLLRFDDYAQALADFIKNEKTGKPLAIGIDAPWGMGKSTLMKMLRRKLSNSSEHAKGEETTESKIIRGENGLPTVWFNAWKYSKEESLWAALALEILAQTSEQFSLLEQARFQKETVPRTL